MIFAYADPPYLGQGVKHYGDLHADGTEILVYWPRVALDDAGNPTGEVLSEAGHISVSSNSLGGWEPDNVVEANGHYFDDDFEFGDPTHWMPLPAPPTKGTSR